jgi:predicted transcriptional regulator YdeE
MNATIETRPAMRLIGMAERLDPMRTDWARLWGERFEPQMEVLGPLMRGPACYGLFYDTGQPPLTEFVGAVMVAPDAEAPSGLVAKDVPAGDYACFECTLPTIGQTWDAIFRTWLPASEYDHDPSRPCFEEFAPGCQEGTTPVRIYTSIRPKG